MSHTSPREGREESTKSQKQKVRVTLRGQREMQKATKVQKNEPKPTARELGAARATQKDSHLDTSTTPRKIRARQLY